MPTGGQMGKTPGDQEAEDRSKAMFRSEPFQEISIKKAGQGEQFRTGQLNNLEDSKLQEWSGA